MRLTTQVKLELTESEKQTVKTILLVANRACDYISQIAWDNKVFKQFALQRMVYHDIRNRFGIGAELAVRCVAKVADAYKLDCNTVRRFKPLGAIAYDSRMLTWRTEKRFVTMWTMSGRIKVKYTCGTYQAELLKTQLGECDLFYSDGEFYLLAPCVVEELPVTPPTGIIGVDLGIVNIATTSDGVVYAGNRLNSLRHRHRRLRTRLQRVGTKSARKLLKRR